MRAINCTWYQILLTAMLLMQRHLNLLAMGDNDDDKNRLSSNPVLNYAEKLQDTGAIQFPVQGTNIFRELCNVYANFKECSQDISCSSISLEAVDASYRYMCGEGYKLFENYAICFAEVEIENNYVKCKNEASAAITAAQKAKIPNDYSQYFELLCEIMDHYLRCCRPVINTHCGRGAWELVRTITLDSLRVTMPACDLHNALL